MGQITLDQSLQVLATLIQNADWGSIDFDLSNLQENIVRDPKGAGAQFTRFLKNGGKVVGEPKIVKISRGRFNPAKFIDQGWSIVADETDVHSTDLAELDLTKIQQHVTMLKGGETRITGEEKLARLKKSDYIRLDADIFLTLWENQHLIPKSWKEKVDGNTRYIFFDGTILRNPVGRRCVLSLYWDFGQWHRYVHWLDNDWYVYSPSAVLASSTLD